MLKKISDFNETANFDCCIIGAGPAGITCALELAKNGKRVLLLEGGQDDISEQSQDIYQGEVKGDPYFDLSVTRLRFFGGSSNHWEGWCRPLDKHDFENKGDFKTAWPITKNDIDGYLKKASSILEIDDTYNDKPIGNSGINHVPFGYSPPVRFLDKYYDAITAHQNVLLLLNANVTSLETDGLRINSAMLESFSGDKKRVKAKEFILATGGLENSRLLLWSNELSNGQVVKNSTSLGRYWMEHPDFTIGSAIIKNDVLGDADLSKRQFLAPSYDTIVKNKILNCGLRINPNNYHGTEKMISDIACVAPKLGRGLISLLGKNLICGYKIRASWEQEPVKENRVTLGPEKDFFSMPRIQLHWKKSKIDTRTVKQTILTLGNYLAEKNLGRLMLNKWLLDEDGYPENDVLAGNHHMGGTRMAENDKLGVVDKNCKVFGQENLYIAGSSVFPSSGYANPTLSIIQLALRLSDHLKNKT